MVSVSLPRMEFEYEIALNDVSKRLGMGIAFTQDADFSRMFEGKGWIDEDKHKAMIEIDEKGTEAAAATVVKMKRGGGHTMIFDRPFFLAIRDNVSGVILFMGVVRQP